MRRFMQYAILSFICLVSAGCAGGPFTDTTTLTERVTLPSGQTVSSERRLSVDRSGSIGTVIAGNLAGAATAFAGNIGAAAIAHHFPDEMRAFDTQIQYNEPWRNNWGSITDLNHSYNSGYGANSLW